MTSPLRFDAALVPSAPIGFDREMRNKAAGMCTQAFAVLIVEFADTQAIAGAPSAG